MINENFCAYQIIFFVMISILTLAEQRSAISRKIWKIALCFHLRTLFQFWFPIRIIFSSDVLQIHLPNCCQILMTIGKLYPILTSSNPTFCALPTHEFHDKGNWANPHGNTPENWDVLSAKITIFVFKNFFEIWIFFL